MNDILELIRSQDGIGTLNHETGEVVMLLDPDVPLEQKADSYAFIMNIIDAEIAVHKEYVSKHKDKIEKKLLLQEKIKHSFQEQMKAQGLTNLKTPETTLYFQKRKKLVFDIAEIPFDYCITEVVKKKPKEEALPELIKQGFIVETTTETLCRR
jgi:hypothetical protein